MLHEPSLGLRELLFTMYADCLSRAVDIAETVESTESISLSNRSGVLTTSDADHVYSYLIEHNTTVHTAFT